MMRTLNITKISNSLLDNMVTAMVRVYEDTSGASFLAVIFLRKQCQPVAIEVVRSKRSAQATVIATTTASACVSPVHAGTKEMKSWLQV